MILSPRGRGRTTGAARETLDGLLKSVGEGARMWRKDFKLNESAGSRLVGGMEPRNDLGSAKGEVGEDLKVVFDHEKSEVLLLD